MATSNSIKSYLTGYLDAMVTKRDTMAIYWMNRHVDMHDDSYTAVSWACQQTAIGLWRSILFCGYFEWTRLFFLATRFCSPHHE